MLKNYFKIAFRNILRNKLRSVIHVLGLSIGISICFLIFNVVWFANSFDNFHTDGDRIFRVTTTSIYRGNVYPNPGVPFPLGEQIENEVNGIENRTHIYTLGETLVGIPSANKNLGRQRGILLASEDFFKLFPREWIAGSEDLALSKPNSVVLSEKSANSYFPDQAPDQILGQEVIYFNQDSIPAVVTGIVKAYEENSDLEFSSFVSLSSIQTMKNKSRFNIDRWDAITSSSQLFVKISENVDPEAIESEFPEMIEKYIELDNGDLRSHALQPLSEVHFTSALANETADRLLLKGLMILGGIILILACLNFVNLETAHAINRAKEVGIRKTLGGNRAQLTKQFLSETFIIVLIACIIAFAFVEILKTLALGYLPENFSIQYFTWVNFGFLSLFAILLTFIAGIYPALVLGKYDPQRALKGERVRMGSFSFGVFLRKNLTVIQFTFSIAFVIMVFVLNSQLRYLSQQEMGFDKEAVLYISTPFRDELKRTDIFKEQIKQQSFVSNISISDDLVSSNSYSTSEVKLFVDSTEMNMEVQNKLIDSSFVAVNGLEIIAGKNISNRINEVLVNEAFVKKYGFSNPEEVIGMNFYYGDTSRVIQGVTNDFHAVNLRSEIKPLLMVYDPEYSSLVNVKLEKGADIRLAKAKMDQIFKELYPLESSEFQFLDEVIAQFYEDDQKLRNVMGFASFLAILISCLGLFGLSSFTIAQRTKEIGIRKVLGATVSQVLLLISKEYVILIGFSFAFASAIAWYFASKFLNEYAFKIEMPYGLFVLSGILILSICLLIVGLHALNASQTNPAKVLKDE
ncbi:ABC transporter permease [Algoriphagus machipongonensis]|uniref:Efflux ABC transporter, permease protein n=1 Tax=Algoriphagus machipongonensis TaxID=388413 RepID=A3I1L7_9BACT|nr:ABC transporter permease [Algoriphagus machipongonensis]EAZ79683.1 efflux ABC transporter, permease protein [Algoriphagus machipongonensis]